ncbi:zinc ribbon domain-containing protein [Streptomyces sp. NBC_01217]|nr:transposase [Streptomyces sp. NBC_01217]
MPFLEVDPAYTSQRCPRCGHTERANRPTRDRPVVGGSRERDKV